MADQLGDAALFSLEGPRADGSVWISSTAGPAWQHHLGPVEKVAEELALWLASIVAESSFQLTQDE
jgi:hypothetical protein